MENTLFDKVQDRRQFIRRTSLIAVAISMTKFGACSTGTEEHLASDDCVTTDDILGPFYRSGAPVREDITPPGHSGTPLIVHGKVLSGCETPVQDAEVEIWNADDQGAYDASDEYRFRGRYQTGSDGGYRFRTIVPGRYLNGNTFRPSHIHFRVTAPGHGELISQIYFRNDPFIKNDPWAGLPKAVGRILDVVQDASGANTVNFSFHLVQDRK